LFSYQHTIQNIKYPFEETFSHDKQKIEINSFHLAIILSLLKNPSYSIIKETCKLTLEIIKQKVYSISELFGNQLFLQEMSRLTTEDFSQEEEQENSNVGGFALRIEEKIEVTFSL
jgi:hypothetical protein